MSVAEPGEVTAIDFPSNSRAEMEDGPPFLAYNPKSRTWFTVPKYLTSIPSARKLIPSPEADKISISSEAKAWLEAAGPRSVRSTSIPLLLNIPRCEATQ